MSICNCGTCQKVRSVLDSASIIQTQKARGLKHLKRIHYKIREFFTSNTVRKTIFYPQQTPPSVDFPRFARPCPMKPEHGFVDSRLINSMDELLGIVDEIKNAGEETIEILLAPFVESKWSAVATTHMLTFGPSNDGATSGRESKTIPLVPNAGKFYEYFSIETSLVKNSPYVEMVYPYISDSLKPEITQLRDGPEIRYAKDYIPYNVTVKNIILAKGDLLEWKEIAKNLKSGDVVYHPGGSLTSHYAVHAHLNKYPVIISHKPFVGESLERTDKDPVYSERDYYCLAQYISHYLQARVTDLPNALRITMAALHNFKAWDLQQEESLRILAFALAVAGRVSTLLLAGEMRHWNGNVGTTDDCPVKGISRKGNHKDRSHIYEKYIGKSAWYSISKLPYLIFGFSHPHWCSSFGGPRWFNCGKITRDFIVSLANFLQSRGKGDLNVAIDNFNALINCVHNNGNFFNKCISESQMDAIANLPFLGFCNDLTYDILYEDINPSRIYPKAVGGRILSLLHKADEDILGIPFTKSESCEDEEGCGFVLKQLPKEENFPMQFKIDEGTIHVQIPYSRKNGYASANFSAKRINDLLSDLSYDTRSLHTDSKKPYKKCWGYLNTGNEFYVTLQNPKDVQWPTWFKLETT